MDANLMNAEEPPGREFWFGTDARAATSTRASSTAPHLAHGRHRLAS
jgi:hypothetical protein